MGLLDLMPRDSTVVLQYENKELQKKALSVIPIHELQSAAVKKLRVLQKELCQNKIKDESLPEIRELLLLELLAWFKNSFFTWVDVPPCEHCHGKTKFLGSSISANIVPSVRVEVYVCGTCQKHTEFMRHEDPWILLETRKGRCGEWANCFTLLCRAMGWDVRRVVDVTDHVWTEVFSVTQDRWIHCDPCENEFDKPLMYEAGWGKNLSYIIAYSYDDIQDVTWRYSSQHEVVVKRRNECSEYDLLKKLVEIRYERQRYLTKARKDYVTRRLLKEFVEFITPQSLCNEVYEGRSSGSLAWRMARGEAGMRKPIGSHVWQPTAKEIQQKMIHIMYSCAQDRYIRPTADNEILQSWESGVFKAESVFRKEEKDWKKVYLVRTEGTSKAYISWKIDCRTSGLLVDKIALRCRATVFQSGKVRLKLCGNVCILVPMDHAMFETQELSGSDSVELSAELFGGEGNIAWQHAQLFRQSVGDESECPLSITVYLIDAAT